MTVLETARKRDVSFKSTAPHNLLLGCCSFIERLPDGNRKAEELASIGRLREAAEVAARSKDLGMLNRIQVPQPQRGLPYSDAVAPAA